MALRIATWNINSVRLRLENLRRLIAAAAPDIICLQETKVEDKDFPRAAVAEMGYPHLQIRGMKSYNGVAILSRNPFAEAGTRDWCGRQDSRH
ncbi:MAG: endonuclease/exonuclease/phosphatase family protein, partial [Alphaproteobacteria bacterium]